MLSFDSVKFDAWIRQLRYQDFGHFVLKARHSLPAWVKTSDSWMMTCGSGDLSYDMIK